MWLLLSFLGPNTLKSEHFSSSPTLPFIIQPHWQSDCGFVIFCGLLPFHWHVTCRDTSGKSHLTNRWDAAIIFLSFFPWTCSVCLLSQNRLWRKSRSQHGNNRCIGTDMNRNFDAQWCGMTPFPSPCTPVSVSACKILNFENIFIQRPKRA